MLLRLKKISRQNMIILCSEWIDLLIHKVKRNEERKVANTHVNLKVALDAARRSRRCGLISPLEALRLIS